MKRLAAILLCSMIVAGCDSNARRDAADERNPLVQKGLEQKKLKHWDEAIRQFEAALDSNSKLASPNLELALIYHQDKKNYVRAIYHYERYLEKRPDSEKRQLILGWIGQARISFAAEAGQQTDGLPEELARLTRENNLLRQQLEREGSSRAPTVQKVKTLDAEPQPQKQPEPQVVQKPVKPEPTPESEKPVERIRTPAPEPETYTVQSGDTLTRIAKTVYGDSSRWKDIYEANKDQMSSENDIKVGQTLIVPKP